jgi:glucosyl-dolichyl phosphate glucuronosyltransferase
VTIQDKEIINDDADLIRLMNSMKISVVIPCYSMDRFEDTLEAIRSAWEQTVKPHEVIISVDHNEALFHRLQKEAPEHTIVLLNTNAHGVSETRNVGIRRATGDIIAFIDDDAVARKDWLENILPSFSDPNVMVIGGESTAIWPKGKAPSWFPDEFDWTVGCTAHKKMMLQDNGEVRNINGNNMVFRSEVFKRIGLLDTELGAIHGKSRGGEEANICLRVKGGVDHSLILYQPKAVVFHKIISGRDTLGHLFSYCWVEGFNRAKMRKQTASYVKNPLSTELSFFRRLVTISIFKRLVRFYRPSNLAQIGAIMGSLTCMAITYAIGRVKYR